jgi:hypothetical protein
MATERDTPLFSIVTRNNDMLRHIRSDEVQTIIGYMDRIIEKSSSPDFSREKRVFVENNLNKQVEPFTRQEVLVTGMVICEGEEGFISVVEQPFTFIQFVVKTFPGNPPVHAPVLMFEASGKTYYAYQESLELLERSEDIDDVADLIIDMGDAAKQYLNRRKFIEASDEDKAAQLRAIEAQVNKELRGLEGTTLEVETTSFMGKYDGMNLSYAESITRNDEDYHDPDLPPVPPFKPYGKYVRALYVELEEYGDGVAPVIERSTLTHGVPCIEIRDELLQATYFVPMDEIGEVTFGVQKDRQWWPAW